jgi:alkanesulfonate monooxygenase SsuD/methylene tetrahydromethanopterin reductase-like flavin-dependent oxidoreductase (luciferase family)
VTSQLPEVAKSAAAVANRYITGAATAEEVISERVRLWRAIEGRDQSDEPDVLKIRTAICVLHPMDIGTSTETLEYFLNFGSKEAWRRLSLRPLFRTSMEFEVVSTGQKQPFVLQ